MKSKNVARDDAPRRKKSGRTKAVAATASPQPAPGNAVAERVQTLKRAAQAVAGGALATEVDVIAGELLAIDDQWLATAEIASARSILEIAGILLPTGRFDPVEQLFGKAIRALWNHPQRAVADLFLPLNNLAAFYEHKGDYRARGAVTSRIVEMAEQLAAPIDAATVRVFLELAQLYTADGQPKAAAILYRQIHRQAMMTPEYSADTRALVSAKYGNALVADGQAGAALAMYETSLAALETQPGLTDERRFELLGLMANAARVKGDLAGTETLLERARDLAERSDESDTMAARAVYHNLASLYVERGRRDRYDEAERLLEHNAAIIAQASGRENADYAGTLGQIANVVDAKGELERAEPLFRESFRAYESARDTKPGEFADFLTDAGFLYLRLQRPDEAVAVFRRARELRTSIPGLSPVARATTVSNLALACFESGALPEAVQWYREAIEVRHRSLEFVAAAA